VRSIAVDWPTNADCTAAVGYLVPPSKRISAYSVIQIGL